MVEINTVPKHFGQLLAEKNSQLLLLGALLVTLAGLLLLFAGLGNFPLFNPDEGLYAEPAREMLDCGEYITTLLNYVVRFTKPPLVIWMMALSYKVLGVTEFAARFFPASCALVLLVSTYFFVARNAGLRVGIYAAAILLTCPLFVGVGRMAITDMPLSLFTAGSIMSIFTALKTQNRVYERLGYVLVGLAVMTKGPVGAVLPCLILFTFYLITGKIKEAAKFFNLPLALIVIGLISLPWFIVEIYITKGAYFQEFIVHENFQRFTSVVDSHKGGWWYHLAAVMGGMFPWSIFIPQAIYFYFRDVASSHSQSVLLSKATEKADTRDWLTMSALSYFCRQDANLEFRCFAICSALITIVLYSASVSKLLPYTLPAFPALAALIAIELNEALKSQRRLRLLVPFLIIALVFGGAVFAAQYCLTYLRDAPLGLSKIVANFSLVEAVVTFSTLALIAIARSRAALTWFAIALFGSFFYFGEKLLPEISTAFEGAVPEYARAAARSNEAIFVFDLRKPGIPFYTHKRVVQPLDKEALYRAIKETSPGYVITKKKNVVLFNHIVGARVIDSDARFALIHWQPQAN